MLLVDTNVLVDVLQNDPQWADWSIAQMRSQARLHALVINPVIYAEMSLSFSTIEALDEVVRILALELREIPRPALFLAAKAWTQVRMSRAAVSMSCLSNGSHQIDAPCVSVLGTGLATLGGTRSGALWWSSAISTFGC